MLEPDSGLPMLVCKHMHDMDQNGFAVMLAAKRPGVTPEVNISQEVHPGFEIQDRSPKQGYQWTNKEG